jgi:hypothetical protein
MEVMMVINEAVAEPRAAATSEGAPLVAVDRNFERRWTAWMARGQVHDRRVRRRFVVSAAVIAIGGAIAFAFVA